MQNHKFCLCHVSLSGNYSVTIKESRLDWGMRYSCYQKGVQNRGVEYVQNFRKLGLTKNTNICEYLRDIFQNTYKITEY